MGPNKRKKHGVNDSLSRSSDEELSDSVEIKSLLLALTSKMDNLSSNVTAIDIRLTNKIDNLEAMLATKVQEVKAEMESRLTTVSNEIESRLQAMKTDVYESCEGIVSKVSKELVSRIDALDSNYETRLDKLERFSLLKDLVIAGVPATSSEDTMAVVGDIVNALQCNLTGNDLAAAYRVLNRSRRSSGHNIIPIVIRFHDEWAKNELLSAYFKKKNLNLCDIGFRTSSRIYINESLTKLNREIFKMASEAKKRNLIFKLFTRRGLVYVQMSEKDRTHCITCVNQLAGILPQTFIQSSTSKSAGRSFPSLTNALASPGSNNPTIITNDGPTRSSKTSTAESDNSIKSAPQSTECQSKETATQINTSTLEPAGQLSPIEITSNKDNKQLPTEALTTTFSTNNVATPMALDNVVVPHKV